MSKEHDNNLGGGVNPNKVQNPYEANETMRLLGHQYCDEAYNPEVRKQMDDIVDARRFTTTFDTAFDMFMLGYIHGKRAERKRRKKQNGTNSLKTSDIMEA